MVGIRILRAAVVALGLALAAARPAAAQVDGSTCRPEPEAACSPGDAPPEGAKTPPPGQAAGKVVVLFFWGAGCPHCERAGPFVAALAKEGVSVESIEVRRDPAGRRRFIETMDRLGASAAGVPTFVVGDAYVVGYVEGQTDARVREMIARASQPGGARPPGLDLPLFGRVEPATVSLPALTLAIGLVDGINPCAMWVLLVLLGLLTRTESTRRMVLYAGTFVVMSGVVYFLFMTAWSAIFSLVGLSRVFTMVLGGVLLGMGLVNLKDLIWFKRGPSLVIPDRVKPRLFRRMREVARAASVPAAVTGIAALAFTVNLVELGCTLGLPAVYTRILSLRGLSAAARFGYLALYNVAYVVPLLVIVAAFILVRRRLALTERAARVLKGVSGALLTVFGALFLLRPDVLVAS